MMRRFVIVTYFPDLTAYTYLHPEEEPPNTVNIGWLDRAYPYPAGKTNKKFHVKLRQISLLRVKQTRGFHTCYFCKGPNRPHGSAEIRVPGEGKVYAAPELVHHYVVAHRYKPPEEFIAAVLAWVVAEDADARKRVLRAK
jgi:hypothetical protein